MLFAYVGTATKRPDESGIHSFQVDGQSGALEPRQFVAQPRPAHLVATTGGHLFAASHVPEVGGQAGAAVYGYTIAGAGTLLPSNRRMLPFTHAAFVRVDHAQRFLLVACSLGGGVAVLPIDPTGALGALSSLRQHHGAPMVPIGGTASKREIAGAKHDERRTTDRCMPHSIDIDPSNRLVAVADLLADRIVLYRFDSDLGHLAPLRTDVSFASNSGPRHVLFDPRGDRLFVVHETISAVTVIAYDAASGVATSQPPVSTLPEGYDGRNSGADIVLSEDGRFLYCSNRGHDSIAILEVSESEPTLRFVGTTLTGGRSPRGIGLAPGGRLAYAANQASNTVTSFLVDPADGLLQPTGLTTAVPAPSCIVFAAAGEVT